MLAKIDDNLTIKKLKSILFSKIIVSLSLNTIPFKPFIWVSIPLNIYRLDFQDRIPNFNNDSNKKLQSKDKLIPIYNINHLKN